MKGAVLVIDDDPALTATLAGYLRNDDFNVTAAHSAYEALTKLEQKPYDFVVTDVKMPGMNGLEFCERVTTDYPNVPVFVVTALASLPTAVEAIRAGAYDFITKPVNKQELLEALNRAYRKRQAHELPKTFFPDCTNDENRALGEIIGDCLVIETARRIARQVGPLSSTVFIEGALGTGKSSFARAIHSMSPREKSGKFIIVRCKDRDPQNLLDELFSAAGTDPRMSRNKGKSAFERAEGGTLYLSNIEALPIEIQNRLLSYLEDLTLKAGEAGDEYNPDVRLICSSEIKLESAVQNGRFLHDLFLRLSSITISLSPLRDRGADILLIADYYLRSITRRLGKRVSGLTQAATERLMMYTWPGNVAELVSVMERAVAMARFDFIRVEDLPEQVKAYRNIPLYQDTDSSNVLIPLEQLEQRHILNVLKQLGGNKTLAARALGLDRKTLYRKLEQYGDDPIN